MEIVTIKERVTLRRVIPVVLIEPQNHNIYILNTQSEHNYISNKWYINL